MVARVTLEIALRKEFDYAIPEEFSDRVAVGSRVKVPFGHRQVLGVVTELAESSPQTNLKPILNVLGAQTLVTPQVLELAGEIENLLQDRNLAEFLPQMYGNQPDRWQADLQGADRWRCVINAFTRLRLCTDDGTMEFKTKEGAQAAPAGYRPWFEVPGRLTAGHPIAFGHWSTLGLLDRADLLSLDSGCVWGGALTAARVDGGRRELLKVPCPGACRPGDGG